MIGFRHDRTHQPIQTTSTDLNSKDDNYVSRPDDMIAGGAIVQQDLPHEVISLSIFSGGLYLWSQVRHMCWVTFGLTAYNDNIMAAIVSIKQHVNSWDLRNELMPLNCWVLVPKFKG